MYNINDRLNKPLPYIVYIFIFHSPREIKYHFIKSIFLINSVTPFPGTEIYHIYKTAPYM